MKNDLNHLKPSAGALVLPWPQTAQTARAWLREQGVSVAELARAHRLPRTTLADLLRGRLRGERGHAHRAAVVLGMKALPTSFNSASSVSA